MAPSRAETATSRASTAADPDSYEAIEARAKAAEARAAELERERDEARAEAAQAQLGLEQNARTALAYLARSEAEEERGEDLRRRLSAAVEALEPFARTGKLFLDDDPVVAAGYGSCLYSPAAGPAYSITSDHVRRAAALVEAERTEEKAND
ncbi:hypothetical protein [Methylopila sp. 73B]|uniref:hypothetical protein n=1 Tax=Methylopila sp. 73B TaxID=1120792 RepID=UPI000382D5E5|nr:hypothetical protein [Methylopila sp. 73B]